MTTVATSKDKSCQFCRGWGVGAKLEEYVSWDRAWNFKLDRIFKSQTKRGQHLFIPITVLTRFYKFLTSGKKQCSFCSGWGTAKSLSQ